MSGSRHISLYNHLLECPHCLISNIQFCGQATAMGQNYRDHVGGFESNKREALHNDFVNAVIRGRVNRWYAEKLSMARAA